MSDQIRSILKSSKPATNGVNSLSQYSKSQLGKIRNLFTQEILGAQIGSNSSLNYQKVKIEQKNILGSKSQIQTFHLGGSHWESALVQFKNQKLEVTNFQSGETKAGQNAQDIFEIIASKIDARVEFLSFSIALPIQQVKTNTGVLDGFLKKGKVHHYDFTDLENKLVGTELEKFLKQTLKRTIGVSVTNDNTSLAFAAQDQNDKAEIITGVVATGVNFGFFQDKSTFINLESGSFDKLAHDPSLSDKPLSRLVASGYLYKEFNRLSLSNGWKETLNSNFELENLAFPDSQNEVNKHSNELNSLAKTLFIRSAQLVAAQIAGIVDFKSKYKKNNKYKIVIEGDLFWKTPGYKKYVEKALVDLSLNLENIEFVKVEFGFVTGSAKSVFRISKIEQKKVLILEKIYSYCASFSWFSLAPPYKF